ncbi:MAG: hypothetical protein D6731_22985 [Planctomycetota bacterium]|nr:MAG: hypothetical protein D6731_22985 [Planctomycetota bacterium]
MSIGSATLVAASLAGSAFGLAVLARGAGRPWPATGALLLGAREGGEASRRLRFAALVGAIGVLFAADLAFPSAFRALAPGELVFLLAFSLPITACSLAALADLLRPLLPDAWRRAPRSVAERRALAELLEGARSEVATALRRVEDPDRVAALEALDEAVGEYERVLVDDKGETARHLRKTLDARLRGVIDMARTCLEEERRAAARALGVAPDATPEQLHAVYAALRDLYEGPGALPGTDPGRAAELRAAYERLRAQTAPAAPAASVSG